MNLLLQMTRTVVGILLFGLITVGFARASEVECVRSLLKKELGALRKKNLTELESRRFIVQAYLRKNSLGKVPRSEKQRIKITADFEAEAASRGLIRTLVEEGFFFPPEAPETVDRKRLRKFFKSALSVIAHPILPFVPPKLGGVVEIQDHPHFEQWFTQYQNFGIDSIYVEIKAVYGKQNQFEMIWNRFRQAVILGGVGIFAVDQGRHLEQLSENSRQEKIRQSDSLVKIDQKVVDDSRDGKIFRAQFRKDLIEQWKLNYFIISGDWPDMKSPAAKEALVNIDVLVLSK